MPFLDVMHTLVELGTIKHAFSVSNSIVSHQTGCGSTAPHRKGNLS